MSRGWTVLLVWSLGACLVCFHIWNAAVAAQAVAPPAPPVDVPLAANDAMPAEPKAATLQKAPTGAAMVWAGAFAANHSRWIWWLRCGSASPGRGGFTVTKFDAQRVTV